MGSPLLRCNGSMKGVLYEELYSVHMLSDQPKLQKFVRYQKYAAYCMHAYRAAGKAAALHRCNGCYVMVGMLSRLGIVSPIGNVALRVLCSGSK